MFSSRNKLVATATTLIALAGSATMAQAASAPTISAPTVFKAGDKTPVTVAGNHLHAGDTIRKGEELLRWQVTLHGNSRTAIALKAPAGYKHVGLALNDGRTLGFAVAKGSSYYKSVIKVRVYALKGTDADGGTGHIYALVKKSY